MAKHTTTIKDVPYKAPFKSSAMIAIEQDAAARAMLAALEDLLANLDTGSGTFRHCRKAAINAIAQAHAAGIGG